MTSQFDHDDQQLTLDWNTDAIVERRNRYYAASQRAFVPYQKPLIFSKGQDQYLWDEKGNRYLDCLSQNLTISVGYNNPVVTRAAAEQVPITVDRYVGARHRANLAEVYAVVGELDLAIDEVEYLLSVPSYMTLEILRHDPAWKVVREHPRYAEVVSKFENAGSS